MSDETYVDPNSGAAPQPGGWVGQHGAAKGFAGAEGGAVEEETSPAYYEAPGGAGTPGGGFPPVESSGSPSEEEKADADASVEHQGVSSLGDGEDEGARIPGNEGEDGADSGDTEADSEESAYDPGDHTVEEVKEYLKEHPDQEEAVLKAEKAGQARKGLVGE